MTIRPWVGPTLQHCAVVGTLAPLRDFLQSTAITADLRRDFWYTVTNVPQVAPLADIHTLIPYLPADYPDGDVTPLAQAILGQPFAFIEEMLALGDDLGASLGAPDADGEGVWHYVAKIGRIDLLPLLDRVFPYADRQTFEDGLTPLHVACAKGRADMVDALRARGADPAKKTYAAETIWSLLVQYGQAALISDLGKALPYDGRPDEHGATPLGAALHWEKPVAIELVCALTAIGADPWQESMPEGETIWDRLILEGHAARAELLALFIGLPGAAWLTLDDVCASGEPPVVYAWLERQGQHETLRLLRSLALLVHAPQESWFAIIDNMLSQAAVPENPRRV